MHYLMQFSYIVKKQDWKKANMLSAVEKDTVAMYHT